MSSRKHVPQKFLEYIRQTYKCVKCTEDCNHCLDFHHVDPSLKRATLTTITSCTPEFLIDEVQRCALVCSNCHRKIHAGILSIARGDAFRLKPVDYVKIEEVFNGRRSIKPSTIKPPKSDLADLIKKFNLTHIAKLYKTDKSKVENWIISYNLYE